MGKRISDLLKINAEAMQRKEIKKSCANCGRYDPKKDCSELCFFEEYEKWIPAEEAK